MSRLSDVISRVVELESGPNGIDLHRAVVAARSLLDDADVDTLIDEALAKRIKSQATRTRREEIGGETADCPSLPFPELRVRYAVDTDGRWLVETGKMKEHQFRRLLDIRRKQIIDDRAHLDVLEQVWLSAAPIWREQPGLSLGEVFKLLAAQAA